MTHALSDGLALHPFRALRPAVDSARLSRLLCPPYDVIDADERAQLLAADPDNAVGLILPEATDGGDPYLQAAQRLDQAVADGLLATDAEPALYVYEMQESGGATTRGLLGAVALRDPADGVILPHENTMAGPVADRLALMAATEANLEPIYLVYDGGGAASQVVSSVDTQAPVAEASTPDGIRHRLWALTDPQTHRDVATDLATRRALIADGHHRYATYRELAQQYDAERGPGPWDRGLTLLVDSSSYGPQVHAIHRVLDGVALDAVLAGSSAVGTVVDLPSIDAGMRLAEAVVGFAAVLTDGTRVVLLSDPAGKLAAAATRPDEPASLGQLDVAVLHRGLVEQTLGLADTVDVVGYAHSVDQAVAMAQRSGGTAVLLRPTPVAAVAAVAAAGARMPRKSTLFTPKPASGLVMRRFADER
ncbi:MAG: hypothetical protein QOF87_4499 [Pseudonocardiales bacterium]|jgi:uncharacterized protein (DUF1015 family)|nr:hypothetical protein [Pseudonocardiales bacterium]MDT4906931.1 hypothetical protein [Pseudonocardiales bacterium]MDT4964852.1 hypothetical protein [Pseudonocardiales bacterium]MDT4973496.1 hypothetical protein [Pseudonocardiales bacterium]